MMQCPAHCPARPLQAQCPPSRRVRGSAASQVPGQAHAAIAPFSESEQSSSWPAAHTPIGCTPCMDGAMAVLIEEGKVITKFIAETLLPTRHGKFRVRGYKHSIDGGLTFTEPTAIMSGRVEGQENVPLRVHDACFTSEVLGSLKCDCAEQLALALERIQANPPGVVIYLQQEGRGIGLANKIAAYSLQERGLDTVDANRALGLPDDCREYTSVLNIMQDLDIKSIQLITNNPRKIKELTALGIKITGRVPCVVEVHNEHNLGYLQTKQNRMDHIGLDGGDGLDGQFCHWDHSGEPLLPTPTALANGGMGLPTGISDVKGTVLTGLSEQQLQKSPAHSNAQLPVQPQ